MPQVDPNQSYPTNESGVLWSQADRLLALKLHSEYKVRVTREHCEMAKERRFREHLILINQQMVQRGI